MHHIGLDVHKNQWTLCILDENGRKQRTLTIRGSWAAMLEALGKLPRPFGICYEASTGYGYLFEELSKIAHSVAVAHPGQLRLIFRSKRKHDRADAEKLAKLLFLGEVPPVHVPPREVRAWRGLIEHRHRLVGERTRAKNAIRALCRSYGVVPPRGLWSRRGLDWLRGTAWPEEMTALRRDMLQERVESLTVQIRRAEKALERYGRPQVGVQVLRSIPGVGMRTAEAVAAYVHEAARFASNKSAGCYFGLVPSQDASGASNRLGHITGQGPATVRKVLAEAAWQGIRRSPTIRAYFERIRRDDPERRKIALVATAHYLSRVMVAMLRTGEFWREAMPTAA